MEKVEITIIGAGVIGLAIAAELSDKFSNIVILEQENTFGQGISSRNSEVIHSGIYYPAQSLKAQLCVEGAECLYKICEQYSIPHKKIGKLIIATNQSETSSLEKFFEIIEIFWAEFFEVISMTKSKNPINHIEKYDQTT